MQAGRFESGCPALAASYKLDPLPGALFTLAECEHKWGKLATALAHYAAYLDAFSRMTTRQKANQIGRDRIAQAQRDQLERDVPRLTIKLGATAPQETAVHCDGEPLGAPSLGLPLPIDPGVHSVTAETSDARRYEEQLTLTTAERQTIVVEFPPAPNVSGQPLPPAGTDVRSSAGASSSPAATRQEAPAPSSAPSRTWLYAAGAVGVGGLAVGMVAGIVTIAHKGTIDRHCGIGGDPTSCDADGKSAADASHVTGLVSDIGFGVGVAGVAAAAVLWATQPRPAASKRGIAPALLSNRPQTLLAGVRAVW
jgi:hypothetical protein